jgi:hypothetical protein
VDAKQAAGIAGQVHHRPVAESRAYRVHHIAPCTGQLTGNVVRYYNDIDDVVLMVLRETRRDARQPVRTVPGTRRDGPVSPGEPGVCRTKEVAEA